MKDMEKPYYMTHSTLCQELHECGCGGGAETIHEIGTTGCYNFITTTRITTTQVRLLA